MEAYLASNQISSSHVLRNPEQKHKSVGLHQLQKDASPHRRVKEELIKIRFKPVSESHRLIDSLASSEINSLR